MLNVGGRIRGDTSDDEDNDWIFFFWETYIDRYIGCRTLIIRYSLPESIDYLFITENIPKS